jgi:hypothetical protein
MKPRFLRWQPFHDLIGHAPFGLLRVMRFEDFHPRTHRSRWLVQCACGSAPFVRLGNSLLSRGETQSCGCAQREKLILRNRTGLGVKRGPRKPQMSLF